DRVVAHRRPLWFERTQPRGAVEHHLARDVHQHDDAWEHAACDRGVHLALDGREIHAASACTLSRSASTRTRPPSNSGRLSDRWPAGKPARTGNGASAKRSRKTALATS